MYALSSAVKHWPLAAEALSEDSNRGFAAIAAGVADADRVIRRKVAFLLGTLVLQARDKWNTDEMPGEVRTLLAEHAKAAGGDIFADLITSLAAQGVLRSAVAALAASAGSTDADDVEYEENLVRALANAASAGGLTPEEKAQVAAIWAKWGAEGQAARGLEGQEANDISDALA